MASQHIRLSDDIWYLPNTGVVIDFAARDSVFSSNDFKAKSKEFEFYKWGNDNLQPQAMLDLVTHNHIKPKLLTTEEFYLYGAGLRVWQRTYDAEGNEQIKKAKHPEINAWLKGFDVKAYVQRCANNLVYSANVFTSFVFTPLGKIASLACVDSTDVRAGLRTSPFAPITTYGVCPDWSETASDTNPLDVVPAYDPAKRQARAIYHAKREQMGQKVYAWADWWGTQTWTEVSNLIPLFHKNGLKNGYNIKYLIKVPKSYFDGVAKTPEEREKKRSELREQMDGFFSGEAGADKSIFTTYDIDNAGRQQPGIIVETVGQTDSDKKYIELSEHADLKMANGHGILPALAGIGDGSNKGTSGSELRLTSQLHTKLNTPIPREILLKPFEIVAARNGWPEDYFIGFEDVELTTLDQNKAGTETVKSNAANPL